MKKDELLVSSSFFAINLIYPSMKNYKFSIMNQKSNIAM